jgi:ABC-2 type transport system ATP-binding protein
VGAVIEKPAFYPSLTAQGNLRAQYEMLGLPKDDASISELLALVGLSGSGSKKAGKFSLGMKQRLGIAIALAGCPDFLVLDEPINGLDPEGIVEIRELLIKLNREKGITVLISSHILSELSLLATHYGFVDKGRIIKQISAQELQSQVRKCMTAQVSDIKALTMVLEKMHTDYEVIDDSTVKIFSKMSVTLLSEKLSAQSCELLSLTESDESLESYFLDLIAGGAHND